MLSQAPASEPSVDERIAALEAALATVTAERDKLANERAQLRAAYDRLVEELALLRHRLFVAKAERVDTKQLELEFSAKKAELDRLAGAVPKDDARKDEVADGDGSGRPKRSKSPSGRRSPASLDHLPETRVVVPCDLPEGATVLGEETSTKLGWQRGGPVKLVVVRT